MSCFNLDLDLLECVAKLAEESALIANMNAMEQHVLGQINHIIFWKQICIESVHKTKRNDNRISYQSMHVPVVDPKHSAEHLLVETSTPFFPDEMRAVLETKCHKQIYMLPVLAFL